MTLQAASYLELRASDIGKKKVKWGLMEYKRKFETKRLPTVILWHNGRNCRMQIATDTFYQLPMM